MEEIVLDLDVVTFLLRISAVTGKALFLPSIAAALALLVQEILVLRYRHHGQEP